MTTKNWLFSLATVAGLTLAACSSNIKKAELASGANPTDEIARLGAGIDEGYAKHYDLLAEDDFRESQEHLKEAKEELADGDSQKDILEEVAYGQAYLERARQTAESRRPQIAGVLSSREEALKSNVRSYPPARERLKKLDNEIRSNADDLSDLDAEEIAQLQSRYLGLQLEAIKNNEIGQARALIKGAKDDDARDDAPKALRRAELDLSNAENVINANRNNPAAYEEAVAKATASAQFLAAVLKATDSGRVNEDTATRIVMQEREIQGLEGRVGSLRGELGEASQEIGQMNRTLEGRERELAAATAAVNMQRAIDQARQEFSNDEAEVFQQGDKLLIRLKAINFPSGSANLPAESMEILSKVRTVAEELGPQAVVVEGHTDSTGSAQINSKLSQDRARTVADYLANNGIEEEIIQAEGFGFERPIASNRSKEGRAQNRRVDILITPAAADASTERAPASVEE